MQAEKRSARERLRTAAFELFAERGYDQTTVEDIAQRAGVGRTTFFRTFRSKDEVVFPDHEALLAAIQARLHASTHETAPVAVVEAARLVLQHYLEEGDVAATRYRLTRTVPSLRDREVAGTQQYLRVFREFVQQWLGERPGAALHAELMASAVVTAHNHVLRRWLRRLTSEPEREFDEAMDHVLELFTEGRRARRDGGPGDGGLVVFRTDRDLDAVLPALRRILGPPAPGVPAGGDGEPLASAP